MEVVLSHRTVGRLEATELVASRLEVALGLVPRVVRAGRDELAQQPRNLAVAHQRRGIIAQLLQQPRDLSVVLGHLRLPPLERELKGEPAHLRFVPGGLEACQLVAQAWLK